MLITHSKRVILVMTVLLVSIFVYQPNVQASSLTLTNSVAISKTIEKTTDVGVASVEAHKAPIVYSPNTYPVGQCTWGAKELAPWVGNNWGNAGEWPGCAAAEGFVVDQTPQVGALMVWTDGGYGHVGVVKEVFADGSIRIEESNYAGNMVIGDYRGVFYPDVNPYDAVVSFIHPKN